MTDWPAGYSAFPSLRVSRGAWLLRPLAWADREPIRRWRNDQIDALRQDMPLTEVMQDAYYRDVVAPQMSMARPAQVLLALEENGILIGYGGIVHIDWRDARGEVSFLTDSRRLSQDIFRSDWAQFLALLQPLARSVLHLHKLTTETYAFRTNVVEFLEAAGFALEGVLRQHHRTSTGWVDSLAHGMVLDPGVEDQ